MDRALNTYFLPVRTLGDPSTAGYLWYGTPKPITYSTNACYQYWYLLFKITTGCFYTVFTKFKLTGDDGNTEFMNIGRWRYEFEEVEIKKDSYDDAKGTKVPSEIIIERTFHDKVLLEEAESKMVVATGEKITHLTLVDPDEGDEYLDRIDQVDIIWDKQKQNCGQIRSITEAPSKWTLFVNDEGKLV
jgi:hypothetical protein